MVGTIGAPFFENRILILDFVGSRVAILDALPAEVERRAVFSPLHRNNKVFVTFTLNGKQEKEMVFDTGSSAFALTPRALDRDDRPPEE